MAASKTNQQQPSQLPEIPGGWKNCSVTIAKQTFALTRPAHPDDLLEEAREECIPYWAYLWPSAYDFSAWTLSGAAQPTGEVLEIGCGIGLCGLAGLAAGWDVTFSDYEPLAVDVALWNARKNGFRIPQGLQLDWRNAPEKQYAAIWGCDVTYDRADHLPLLDFLCAALQDEGICWLTDSNRADSYLFANQAAERGFGVERQTLSAVHYPARPTVTSMLWKIIKQH